MVRGKFYQSYFESCQFWTEPSQALFDLAESLASQYGLNAMDALQVASAIMLGSDELITTEKQTGVA